MTIQGKVRLQTIVEFSICRAMESPHYQQQSDEENNALIATTPQVTLGISHQKEG